MKRRDLFALAGAALFLPSMRGWAQGVVTLDQLQIAREGERVVLSLHCSVAVRERVFALSDPDRLVIDLPSVSSGLANAPAADPSLGIEHIRFGEHDNGLRLVLDLSAPAVAQARWRQADAGGQVLELGWDAPGARTAAATTVAVAETARPIVVAIDAGHGGKDPGAIGQDNHYEKHVALSVATLLQQRLEADARFQPVMIRSEDVFVPLHQRVVRAQQRNADMFISIHADAAPTSSAQGASVYALSEHGATSAMARWLEESENSADRYGGVFDRIASAKDPTLSKVLADLSMRGTISASLQLGHSMLDQLGQVTRLHQHQVNQAGFAVLKAPEIPSLLVETGFMSNRDDCLRLVSDKHQEELAMSLFSGIGDYFSKYQARR